MVMKKDKMLILINYLQVLVLCKAISIQLNGDQNTFRNLKHNDVLWKMVSKLYAFVVNGVKHANTPVWSLNM